MAICPRLALRLLLLERVDQLDEKNAYLLQLVPPSVNLLPAHIVPMGNLSDRRTVEPYRHDNVELLLVTPTPPPFFKCHIRLKQLLSHIYVRSDSR